MTAVITLQTLAYLGLVVVVVALVLTSVSYVVEDWARAKVARMVDHGVAVIRAGLDR